MSLTETQTIEIVVNGEPRSIPAGLTVAGVLGHLGVDSQRVAIELNRQIVRQPRWADTTVDAGSQIEIVQFVGGG
jgi:thiamine biosynthesis protein ThiS